MTKYGYLGPVWEGTGIAPPGTHPLPHPGYTPPAPTATMQVFKGTSARVEVVVGLRSVDQLTLDARISGLQGITEGYNL